MVPMLFSPIGQQALLAHIKRDKKVECQILVLLHLVTHRVFKGFKK
jgi:hypothetical protein